MNGIVIEMEKSKERSFLLKESKKGLILHFKSCWIGMGLKSKLSYTCFVLFSRTAIESIPFLVEIEEKLRLFMLPFAAGSGSRVRVG